MNEPVLDLTIELCRRASLTPDDAGCQALLAEHLAAVGFQIETLRFGAVDNLWAWHGSSGPVFALLGHTDVVPPGKTDVEATRATVNMNITMKDGTVYRVQYAMYPDASGAWKLENLVLEGINLGLTYRNNFAEMFQPASATIRPRSTPRRASSRSLSAATSVSVSS